MSRRRRINRLVRDGRYRQSEDGVIEAASDGTFTVRSWDRDHAWEQLGATWIDADNQVGETARIAFVQGNPLLPVFFSRGSKPGSRFVPERTAYELVWRFRSDWECSLGANKPAYIPGAELDLTEQCEASFQYWEFIVKRPDGVYVAVGPISSTYNGLSYLMAWNFLTGEELWEAPALCYDAFPQVEYIPSLNAVFASGWWIYFDGSEYSYTEAPRLYDMDTGALLLGSEFIGGEVPDFPNPAVPIDAYQSSGVSYLSEERPRKWFIDRLAEVVRYQLPYSDELAAQSLFHERIIGLAGYQLAFAGGEIHQAPATLTYEGTPGSAGVLLENTAILYNWNYEFYEACDFNSKPVKAWVGFGYRRLGVGLEWNQPRRYPNNPKRRSIGSTTTPQHEANYANPEYYSTVTEYAQTEVDRIGLKIQAVNAEGDEVEWERTWDINDHTQIVIDGDPKNFATLESEWQDRVRDDARNYYYDVLGSYEPGGFRSPSSWTLDLTSASIVSDPHLWSIQADLTTGIPGENISGGWGITVSSAGINLKFSAFSDRQNVHLGNFSPNYQTMDNPGIGSYATGIHGGNGSGNIRVNLYSPRITSTRTNGDRIVVNYTTPSNMDLIAGGYYTARRWLGTKTGGNEDIGYADLNGARRIFMVDDPSELPQYPEDAPFGNDNNYWIVANDCNGYRGETIELGGEDFFRLESWHFFLSINRIVNTDWFKLAFVTSEDLATTQAYNAGNTTPLSDSGYDAITENKFFDPFTRTWENDGLGYVSGTSPNRIDVCEDFEYRIARRYNHLPRGGKSAVTVLREVDGALVEECTLEFGDDYQKYNSHGTSRYPYVNGTPGVNGLWVDRAHWADPAAWDEGDHTTKVERYDWDGTLVYSHDVPGNPWEWIVVCGNDVASGEDFLLIQNLSTWDLHLYDETGFVRTYETMTDRLYNGSFWIVDNEIYYTQYGAETLYEPEDAVGTHYTFGPNKVIKL